MDFVSKIGTPEKQHTPCLVVAVHEGGKLSAAASAIDHMSNGLVKKVIKSGDIQGKPGDTLLVQHPAGTLCERLLLVGCGSSTGVDARTYDKIIAAAATALTATQAKKAVSCLDEVNVKDRDSRWKSRHQLQAIGDAMYHYTTTKSEKNDAPKLDKLTLLSSDKTLKGDIDRGIKEGSALVTGMNLTKELANLPGNICTPSYLAEQAKTLGKEYKGIETRILEENEMEKLGMGSLLSVSRGSRQPAKLIVMEYAGAPTNKGKGKKKRKPIVLVGKGLTFDAGGISLKPAAAMDEMKYDMCGGASVFGVIKAIAAMELPIDVVGVVPSSENLPDGDANKPGDIVTSMSGQTIEILNTDAEGRLILCDALTYSKRFEPAEVIDIATLTGACIVALGKHAAGLLGNDDSLVNELLEAGQISNDRAWQLPLWDEYDEQLKSNFADMANIGGKEAGTITAACFLGRYTREYKWAHLDIAGTAWVSGANKGATGRPVPMLVQYLLNKADA